jgi:c-di-GMP-binding flagellar brake protein YcgR
MPKLEIGTFASKRRAWRFNPEHADEAFAELVLEDGSHWRQRLVVIGAGGFGFSLNGGCPPMAVGTRIDQATIQVGGLRITGSVRVAYVTEGLAAETICGVEFVPSTDADERRLGYIIGRLEKRHRRSG